MRSVFTKLVVAASAAAMAAGAPLVASAGETGRGLGSIVNCDASGNKQAQGAIIGAVAGAVIGNNVSRSDSAPLVGGLAGAAAGSYIGCQQQRAKGRYQATTTVNVRSAPSTRAGRVTQLRAGQRVQVLGYQGDWAVVNVDGMRGYVAAGYLVRA